MQWNCSSLPRVNSIMCATHIRLWVTWFCLLKFPVSRYQHEDARKVIIRLEQCAQSSMQRAIASQCALAIFYGRHLKHYIKKAEASFLKFNLFSLKAWSIKLIHFYSAYSLHFKIINLNIFFLFWFCFYSIWANLE